MLLTLIKMMYSARCLEQSGCPDLFHGTPISYDRNKCHWISVSESDLVVSPKKLQDSC